MAAIFAFKDGMRKAQPTLLEPIMSVEVETPEQFMGNVIGDLSGRRGMLHGQEEVAGTMVIKAQVPLAEMFGYSTQLRSLTQGRATYTMEFKHYAEAPKQIAEGGDDERAGEEVRRGGEELRPDRRGAGGKSARDHDQHRARGVRDGEAPLRARGLPGACRLHQEHDHGGGADGRGDSGGQCR